MRFDYLLSSDIDLICTKQIDIKTVNNIFGYDVLKNNPNLLLSKLNFKNLNWSYSKNFTFDGGLYKAVVHWSWWTFISGNWGLDLNNEFCDLVQENAQRAAEFLSDIIEILPGAFIAVAFIISDIILVLTLTNHSAGIYMNLEFEVSFFARESDVDWSKVN